MKICIVGTSRCGTTLLRDIIHSHPDICLFNETHWLPRMYEFVGTQRVCYKRLLQVAEKTTWNTGLNLFDVNLKYSNYDSYDSLHADFEGRLRNRSFVTIPEFMMELAHVVFGEDAEWGDKTPDYGYYMGVIHELWPSCKFIHIIRDGLATGRSMSKHSGCQLMISAGYDNWCSLSYDGLYEKYEIRSLPLKAYVSSWRRRLDRIRDEATRLPNDLYLECSYDQLLEGPEEVLNRIANFSCLDVRNEWLSRASHRIRAPRSEAPSSGIDIALLGPRNVQAISAGYGARHFLNIENASEAELRLRSLQDNEISIEARIHIAISVFVFAMAASRDSLVDQAASTVAELLERTGYSAEVKPWSRLAHKLAPAGG